MSPLKVGAAGAAILAGYPLYAQVQAGGLDGTGALERWALIALACAGGAHILGKLITNYEQDTHDQDADPGSGGDRPPGTGPEEGRNAPNPPAGGPGGSGA